MTNFCKHKATTVKYNLFGEGINSEYQFVWCWRRIRHPLLIRLCCCPLWRSVQNRQSFERARRFAHSVPVSKDFSQFSVHRPQKLKRLCCPSWSFGQNQRSFERARRFGSRASTESCQFSLRQQRLPQNRCQKLKIGKIYLSHSKNQFKTRLHTHVPECRTLLGCSSAECSWAAWWILRQMTLGTRYQTNDSCRAGRLNLMKWYKRLFGWLYII